MQELHDVLSFMHKKAKVTEVKDQIHAIWCVLSYLYMVHWQLRCVQVLCCSRCISPTIGVGMDVLQGATWRE